MERDSKRSADNLNRRISTHTLTWSVTSSDDVMDVISEHFNSHAHVERDFDKLTTGSEVRDFNSHAHVERDFSRLCSNPTP